MMKLFLIPFTLLFAIGACNSPKSGESTQSTDPDTTARQVSTSEEKSGVDTTNWQVYKNDASHFRLKYPPQWQVVEEGMGSNMPIINVYSQQPEGDVDLPITVHAPASVSHISFYPKGWGTEMPSGDSQPLKEAQARVPVDFPLNQEQSILFSLENGTAWGYFLVPDSPPAGWSDEGFIMAQIAVDNFQAQCVDEQTGEEKEMQNCDPLMGDRIERSGTVNEKAQAQVRNILASIQFTGSQEKQQGVSSLIQVENPLPNEEIQSPLTIKGKARGTWYFEAEFTVLLKDQDNNVLARSQAVAQGPWMTEDFVPFEATLRFDPKDEEQGEIVLQKANPSGMEENEQSYSIPVLFPPSP